MSLDLPGSETSSLSASSKNLRATGSSVDPGTFLLRLAGKQKVEEKPVVTKDKGKPKNDKKCNNKKLSTTKDANKPVEACIPIKFDENDSINFDVTEDMDETTLATFRDLFNMLDQSNTGIITVDNLYEELQHVDSEITYSEVEDVLKKVDKDGNGEIDFDEFLYHMTRMGGELFMEDGATVDEDQKRNYTRRQRLFYSAITQFSIKQTLADIEKTFRKQAPHVISHYTAGVRLIGLTTRQLERQMKRMQKTAAQNDSPYAKPLQFVHMGAKRKIVHRENIKSPRIMKDKPAVSSRDLNQCKPEINDPENDATVENLSQEITNTMRFFAQQRGSIVSKLQDANLIMQLRQKIGKVQAKMLTDHLATAGEETIDSEETIKKKHHPKRISCRNRSPTKKKHTQRKLMLGLGWTTPRIQYMEVPLPSMKMKLKSNKPTFNDLHRIRAKANEAIDSYYHNLRQTEIRNAWDHWDRLYADVILPKKLLDNFRTVYSAYSPHREEEAFVVCPWKPGPFSYIRHMPKLSARSLPNAPDFMTGRHNPGVIRRSNDLVVRPLTALSTASSTSKL